MFLWNTSALFSMMNAMVALFYSGFDTLENTIIVDRFILWHYYVLSSLYAFL